MQEKSLMVNKDVHEEANMIRAHMLGGEKANKNKATDFEFSNYSYEEASKFLDELKKSFRAEPEILKSVYKLGRIFHNAAKVVGWPIAIVDMMLYQFASNFYSNTDQSQWAQENKPDGIITPVLKFLDEKLKDILTDPNKKMNLLKKMGEKFTKEETLRADRKEDRKELYEKLKKEFEPEKK